MEVTGNGSKTWKALLKELYDLADKSKISGKSIITSETSIVGGTVGYWSINSNIIEFTSSYGNPTTLYTRLYTLSTTLSNCGLVLFTFNNGQATRSDDSSNTVVANGTPVRLYY